MKTPIKFLIGFLIFALLPVAAVMISSSIAHFADCDLHEGYTNPCIVLGADLGNFLYTLFVSGWFALITLPIGGAGVVFSLAWLVIGFFTSKNSKK